MGLKVWLPLNGDLENKGCDGEVMTSLGTDNAFTTGGKIGTNCAHLIKISGNISIPSMAGAKQMSFAYWVKVNNAWSTNWLDGIRWYSTNGSSDTTSRQEFYTNCTQIGVWFAGDPNSISGKAFTVGVWHHLAFTIDYNSGNANFYIDGTSVGTATGVNTGHYLKNGIFTIGDNGVDISMNDVRIYDHVLSAKEVKEISQGLVLHYKLDDPNPNLIPISTFENDPWKSAIAVQEVYKGRLAYRLTNNTLYTKTSNGANDLFSGNITYAENTQYTLSVTWRDDYRTDGKNSSLYLRFNYTDGSTVTNMISPANSLQEWKHQSITSTVGKTVSKITTTYGNGGYLYVTDLKLEVGTIDTGFAMNERIVSDSSGYGHNGVITGDIRANTSTSRHSSCTNFPDSACSIGIGNLSTIVPNGIFTFNIWFKKVTNEWSSKSYETILGGPSGFELEAKNGSTNSPVIKYYSWGGATTTYTLDEWHMLTMVRTTSDTNFYLDGELKVTGSAGSIPSGDYFIGAWQTAIKQNYRGYLSDARIYTTALSIDDVLDLYHTSMSVDNLQNIHTFEFLENNTTTQISKQGQVKTITAQEAINQSLTYDKTLYTEPDGSTWIHIFHHNNPANARFTGSAEDWSDGRYLDADRWYNVEPFLNDTLPYEFMVKQKTTSTATETKYRWIQTPNPLTATWTDVQPGTVTFITTEGYSNSSYGGMYLMKSSNLHMCIANSSNGNWYGGIGVSTVYQNGIPGYPNTVVTSGYIDLYLRFYPTAKIIKNIGIGSNNLIER